MRAHDIVRLLLSLKGHVPKGRAPALRVPERELDREGLGAWRRTPGIPVGQLEDRRYSLPDGCSLHEHVHRDEHSVFHVDAGDVSRSILTHCAKDTRGPEGAAVGLVLGLVLRHPVVGCALGAATGAAIPRGRLVTFDLRHARLLLAPSPARADRSGLPMEDYS